MSEQKAVLPTDEAPIEKRVYLATPYSSTDPDPSRRRTVEAARFQATVRYLGVLHRAFPRVAFYSPIVHWHPVAYITELRTDAAYWQALNEYEISRSDEVWVARFPGWEFSTGIKAELEFADKYGIPSHLEDTYTSGQAWPMDYRGEYGLPKWERA